MPISTSKELKQYRKMMVREIEADNSIGKTTLKRLQSIEKILQKKKYGYGLPYFIAVKHHEEGISLNQLAKEFGIYINDLIKMLDYYGILRKTKSEAVRKNWEDHEFRERNAEAVRKKWKDPEFRERNAEAVRKTKYSMPITREEARTILKLYDEIAVNFDDYESLVSAISKKSSIRKDYVANFLNKVLE